MRRTIPALALVAATAVVAAADDKPAAPPKPKMIPAMPLSGMVVPRPAEIARIRDQYQNECQRFAEAVFRADPAERARLVQLAPRLDVFAVRAGRLVAANPKDQPAFDALVWLTRFLDQPAILKELAAVPGAKPADPPVKVDPLALLVEHHLNNPKLAAVCQSISLDLPGAEALVRAAAEKSTAAEVRGPAGYRLAMTLKDGSEQRAEALFERLADDPAMADVKLGGRSVKALAEGELKEIRLLAVGKPLPDVTGEGLDGQARKVSDYKGKVVVVDVWATWCGPCKAMIPHEREMVKRLEGKPFALISVSCDEEKETLTKFLAKESMPWVHWWVGRESALGKALNIRFYPTIYVLDAKGVIRHKNIRGEKLEAAVEALLKEATN